MTEVINTRSGPSRNSSKDLRADVVVAGFGSPHGDDQAGWQVVALLRRRSDFPARLVEISEGTQLIDELNGCQQLVVVDACLSGRPIGTISRLEWPDPRIRKYQNHSTHGVGLCNALELAERLGRMPQKVQVFGIEVGSNRPLDESSAEVARAVSKLSEIISAELGEEFDARAVVN